MSIAVQVKSRAEQGKYRKPQVEEPPSNGLLIRRFRVRFPGDPPPISPGQRPFLAPERPFDAPQSVRLFCPFSAPSQNGSRHGRDYTALLRLGDELMFEAERVRKSGDERRADELEREAALLPVPLEVIDAEIARLTREIEAGQSD